VRQVKSLWQLLCYSFSVKVILENKDGELAHASVIGFGGGFNLFFKRLGNVEAKE
jgi:hypothetical protein